MRLGRAAAACENERRMKGFTPLVVLLGAATAAVDLAALVWLRDSPVWPDGASVAALGLALGQIALLAAHLAWGRWNILIRVVLLAAAVLFWSYPVAGFTGSSAEMWVSLFLLYAAMVAAPAAAARMFGVQLAVILADGTPAAAGSDAKHWQFSLWGIFSAMTAVAVLLGLRPWLGSFRGDVLEVVVFAAVAATTAHVALWPVACCRNVFLAAAIVVPFCAGAGLLLPLTRVPPPDYAALAAVTAVEGAAVAVSMIVVRIAGFQLRRVT